MRFSLIYHYSSYAPPSHITFLHSCHIHIWGVLRFQVAPIPLFRNALPLTIPHPLQLSLWTYTFLIVHTMSLKILIFQKAYRRNLYSTSSHTNTKHHIFRETQSSCLDGGTGMARFQFETPAANIHVSLYENYRKRGKTSHTRHFSLSSTHTHTHTTPLKRI